MSSPVQISSGAGPSGGRAADVVIIGGGVIGSAIAAFLAVEHGIRNVVVVERDPSYAQASSTLSAGSIRRQFSTAVNIDISTYGWAFLTGLDDWLGEDWTDARPAVPVDAGGYLFLATDAGMQVLRQNHALQNARGAATRWMTPDQLRTAFPWMQLDDIASGCWGQGIEGWFDGAQLLGAFKAKARAHGVRYLHDRVVGLLQDGRRVTGVRLAGGQTIAAGVTVCAAGPRAGLVARMAGIDLPVVPRKRCIFHLTCPEPLSGCPMVIDPSGFYIRPEGHGFICGRGPGEDPDVDPEDFELPEALFEEEIWPLLAERIPAMDRLRMESCWAGHYAYNTVDQNAVLGPHPQVEGLLFANGFSGHGLQQSPAVGRGIAEWIAHGRWVSLDLSDLGWRRILENRPLIEKNVV